VNSSNDIECTSGKIEFSDSGRCSHVLAMKFADSIEFDNSSLTGWRNWSPIRSVLKKDFERSCWNRE